MNRQIALDKGGDRLIRLTYGRTVTRAPALPPETRHPLGRKRKPAMPGQRPALSRRLHRRALDAESRRGFVLFLPGHRSIKLLRARHLTMREQSEEALSEARIEAEIRLAEHRHVNKAS